jgi:hypothetical protein
MLKTLIDRDALKIVSLTMWDMKIQVLIRPLLRSSLEVLRIKW